MSNPLTEEMKTGTIGELFSQLKLLEFGIQAAPPIKDSGNDLIAIKGRNVKFIQIKTRLRGERYSSNLPEIYDLVFHVHLNKNDAGKILFDKTTIKVFSFNGEEIGLLTQELVNRIWA